MVSLFTKGSQDSPKLLFSRRTAEAQLNPAVPETHGDLAKKPISMFHLGAMTPWPSINVWCLWRGQFCGFKRAFWRQKDSRLSRLCSPPRFKFLQWFQWLTCQMPSHRPFATFSRSFDDTLQVTVGLTGGYWEQLHSNRLCRRKGYGLVSSVIRLWVSTSEQSLYQYLI